MDASPKTLAPENPSLTGDWTVVVPRRYRCKPRKSLPSRIKFSEQDQDQQWAPTDHGNYPDRESKLMQKMLISLRKLEDSRFYGAFLNQLQAPTIMNSLIRVLGFESTMQMVVYGIGSIESYETPRLQLSLAILMKRKFSWIGEVEVFDPILSTTEIGVLRSLGCSVLSINERGQRQVSRPTMFFMPHCEVELHNNLLLANWRVNFLKQIALLGNSFEAYERHAAEFKNSVVADSGNHVLAAQRFTKEAKIDVVTEDYFGAFHDLSWHFFNPACETELHHTLENAERGFRTE